MMNFTIDKVISPFSKSYWQCALSEIYSPIKIAIAANIIAIRVILKVFSIQVFFANNLYISFEFLFNAIGSIIYGPIIALFSGASVDFLSYIFFPRGAYYLPFTILEMLSSFIFALFLYKTNITLSKIVISKLFINIFINVIGNYFALYFLYGNAAVFDFWVRLFKNLLLLPLEIFCLSIFLKATLPIVKKLI